MVGLSRNKVVNDFLDYFTRAQVKGLFGPYLFGAEIAKLCVDDVQGELQPARSVFVW